MVSKIKVASGLLCALGAFCVFQLVTVGLGFWSLTRTHDDVGDLSNIASSVEELTVTVRQNAEHVREANALEGTALEATSRGSAVVNEVVDKMRGIVQSSDKIAEIISVIDGIALQTNILALNAAVEAARAGEQASSLEQKSTGIEQVSQAVGQMDEMTQQNAGFVEQAAAAAASLRPQTQQLKQAVSVFEISETVLRMQHIDHLRGPMTGLSLSDMRAISVSERLKMRHMEKKMARDSGPFCIRRKRLRVPQSTCGYLGRLDVCSLLALRALLNFKRHLLVLLQGLEAAALNFRKVREKVLAAVVRRDEAKALCIVKPLHSTCCHF